MANKTKIEWTKSVWNPIVGCSLVSPGCTHCYAMRDAWRKGFNPKTPMYHGLTKKVNGKPVWTGETRLAAHKLDEPLRRRTPDLIFVNSMSDLFHESVPDEWIDRVFAVMALAPQHTFQVLTKRAARMREYFEGIHRRDSDGIIGPSTVREVLDRAAFAAGAIRPGQWLDLAAWPLPNVWLGVSIEDQARAEERIPDLLTTPAAVRWISAEPLLGPLDLSRYMWPVHASWPAAYHSPEAAAAAGAKVEYKRQALVWAGAAFVKWAVAGGESGPGARPMHPDWIRSLRDQCAAAGVPFFFKQWGDWAPDRLLENVRSRGIMMKADGHKTSIDDLEPMMRGGFDFSGYQHFSCVGKKAAGALLDGDEYREWPNGRP